LSLSKNRGFAACCAERLKPFRPSGQKEKNNKVFGSAASGKPEAFRTVPVGLWADPVVTRKFHVALGRINNLRELSGEQAAKPRHPIANGQAAFFTIPALL